jgi:hypothetical protein
MTVSTIAAELHQAMYAAAKTIFEPDQGTVGVYFAAAPVEYYDQAVTMGGVKSDQDVATMGASRGRNETPVITMFFEAFIAGDPEVVDPLARNAAFALLNRFAEHARSAINGDTTFNGTVEWCFLTSFEADRQVYTEPAGSMWSIAADFTSLYRIRG